MSTIDILKINNKEQLIEAVKNSGGNVNEGTSFFAFLGDPAEHSLSPLMHNIAFKEADYPGYYFASRVPAECLCDAIDCVRAIGIKGVNLSMPHKKSVMAYLDFVDKDAALCDAVNTVYNDGGALKGYNTDSVGALKALRTAKVNIKDENITLFGLGGAGKAVLVGLLKEGAKNVFVYVRNKENPDFADFIDSLSSNHDTGRISLCEYGDEEGLRTKVLDSNVLINATNVGMGVLEGESLVPDSNYLHRDLSIMDVIYSPSKTKLLLQGESAGCKTLINGLPMLIYQGEEAFRIFTSHDMNIEAVENAITG